MTELAQPENEDYQLWYACSFCDSTVAPESDNPAISWKQYMELVHEGLSTVFVTGSEQGNPPTGGGDGLEWLDVSEVLSYCDDAVGGGGYLLEREIGYELADDVWTYRDFGWDKAHLPFGWKRFKEYTRDSDQLDSSAVLSPRQFLGRLEAIVTYIVDDAITVMAAGTALWRARPHDEPKPDFVPCGAELGSAPTVWARDNRFSPAGVSMFYGADDIETVFSEIDYASSSFATVGRFETTRDLVVLDLSQVTYYPSIFDPNERDDYYAADFLHGFVYEIARPLAEGEDYRPTQRVVSEGIQMFTMEPVDGIRYRSAKHPDRCNYVLFFDNAECSDLGTDDEAVLKLDPASIRSGVPLMPRLADRQATQKRVIADQ
ncbi:RES family NAD+ phosphorylase [Prescottella equi]|uniref:RES family NAD+ phosphorylase n=1 Tax=Rhodococcus hoagii TaxID=43767 RepID=UPI0023DB4778|nr:RES family NAD+ phosphorylase [Prescottella equi]